MAERYDFYVHDNRKITFNLTEPIMREDSGVTDFVFHIPKVLNELEVSDWQWWLVFVNAKKEKYSIALTLSDDPESPLEKNVATYTVGYAMSIKAGSVQFALEAINAGTGGAIDNEWHTLTYETKVKETLQGNQAEYAETESDIISELLIEVRNKVNQLVGGATPTPVNLKSLMTDHDKVYLYTGSEDGESTGYWYHWNGTQFVPGGQYGAGVTDAVPTQGSSNAVSSGGVYDALDTLSGDINNLKSGLSDITEDYGTKESWLPVTLDLTHIANPGRTPDSVGSTFTRDGSHPLSSTVTAGMFNVFSCEANKIYRLTVANGATPAQIVERATIVIAQYYSASSDKIVEVFRKTNTANATDVYEFTPNYSGNVYFNVDANYASIAVDVKAENVSGKTAVDNVAREQIETLRTETETAVSELDEKVSAELDTATETVNSISDSIEQVVYKEISIDDSDVYNGYSSGSVGDTLRFTESTKTKCVKSAFTCEANKTYKIVIANGSSASISERRIAVFATNGNETRCVYTLGYRNTNDPSDTILYTPTSSGQVYINVNANFTGVTVFEQTVVSSKTAVDSIAREKVDTLFHNQVPIDPTFESGTFDLELNDVSGDGYRSQTFDIPQNSVVCVKVNPTFSFAIGDGESSVVVYHGVLVRRITSGKLRLWIQDTAENCGLDVRVYKYRGMNGVYDVTVAASNSSEQDKAKADIICDGANDEIDLQFAVNWNYGYSYRCNVLLLPGTYNIDAFNQYDCLNGTQTVAKFAVMTGNILQDGSKRKYNVSLSGVYNSEHGFSTASTLLNVTNAAIATLSDVIDNVVIGVCRAGTETGGKILTNGLSLCVENISIYTGGINNKIIGIDAYTAGQSTIKNCDIWSKKGTGMSATEIMSLPEGSIAIRAGYASCLGVRQLITGCRMQGFREGIAICGEHFIVQDNLELRCYYGITVNNYSSSNAQHPNVFIGNSIEQCYKMGKFRNGGSPQSTIIYIGGSVESLITNGNDEPVAMMPFEIESNTKCRGRIESDSLYEPYNTSFFEEGYGSTFVQTIYPYRQA